MSHFQDTQFDELINHATLDLRDYRKTLGLSVAQASSALGVSPSTFEAWESGRRNPKMEIEKLNSALLKHADCISKSSKPIFGKFDFSYARAVIGVTISELAYMVGLSPHTLRAYEQGRRIPAKSEVLKLELILADTIKKLDSITRGSA